MFRARCAAAALAVTLLVLTAGGLSAQTPTDQGQGGAQPTQPPQPTPPTQPPAAQPAEPTPPPQAQPTPPGDAFGEELQVPAKTIIFLKGTASWDSAYDTLVDSFKTVQAFIQKENLKQAGPMMTIYISTDDSGFEFRAAIPVAEAPANPPKGDIELGQSPAGKMLKFVHRGSYDSMDTTYEAITNYLDTKQLEAQETFIEEYETDPLKTGEDALVINVLVPVK